MSLELETKKYVKKTFTNEQDWKDARLLGGSDVPALLGLSRYKKPKECLIDICSRWTDTPVIEGELTEQEIKDNAKTQCLFHYGHEHEKDVFDTLCAKHPFLLSLKEKGVYIKEQVHTDSPEIYAKKDNPFLTASIDGYVELSNGDIYIVEIKTHTYGKGEFMISTIDKKTGAEVLKPKQYVGKILDEVEFETKHLDYIAQTSHYLNVVDNPRIKGVLYGVEDRNQEFDIYDFEKQTITNDSPKSYQFFRMMKDDKVVQDNIKNINKNTLTALKLIKKEIDEHPEIYGENAFKNIVVPKAKKLYDYTKNKSVENDFPPKK